MGLFLRNSLKEMLNWKQILSLELTLVSILKSEYKYDLVGGTYLHLGLAHSEEQIAYIL
jgi:hypothetical protein